VTSQALERLVAAVEEAKRIPLTGQIRIESEEAFGLLDQVRAEIPQATPALERLEALIEAGRPIPLSGEVRIDRRSALSALNEARGAEGMLEGFSPNAGRRRFFER
jgi:hypothetical protein